MAYDGTDRRRNRLYVTRNTEYHCRGKRCVAVRDLWSGTWLSDHPAIGRKLFGALLATEDGLEPLDLPSAGSILWFENGDNDILTSSLQAVTRPPKRAVRRYPEAATS